MPEKEKSEPKPEEKSLFEKIKVCFRDEYHDVKDGKIADEEHEEDEKLNNNQRRPNRIKDESENAQTCLNIPAKVSIELTEPGDDKKIVRLTLEGILTAGPGESAKAAGMRFMELIEPNLPPAKG